MSSLVSKDLFQLARRTPLLQIHRYRGKINIQRPRQPHYERARVIAVTTPIYPEPPKTKDCFVKLSRSVTENPYDAIIAREVLNWLNHSKMVGIFHLNSITSDELFSVRIQLHKENMHLKDYGLKIVRQAVQGTRYEAIIPLFDSQHCIVFSTEERVARLLKITRKVPQMVLIAGIVDDTLLSRNEFMDYALKPSLNNAQAELVQTLNMAATSLVQNLEAHQNGLANILDVYAKGEGISVTKENSKATINEEVKDS